MTDPFTMSFSSKELPETCASPSCREPAVRWINIGGRLFEGGADITFELYGFCADHEPDIAMPEDRSEVPWLSREEAEVQVVMES